MVACYEIMHGAKQKENKKATQYITHAENSDDTYSAGLLAKLK